MVIIMKSSLKSDLKNTLIKNDKICFTKYSKVYLFTTENIKGYYSKLDFENKKILVTCSSGDHILNAILLGCTDITCFDINIFTYYFMNLKYTAIKYLSYEDFIDFFSPTNFFIDKIYYKFSEFLPSDVKAFWDSIFSFQTNEILDSMFYKIDYEKTKYNYNLYLEKNNYIKLQKILLNNVININFYESNVLCLNRKIKGLFDYMFLSNIIDYLPDYYKYDDYKNYIDIVKKYKKKYSINTVFFHYYYSFNKYKEKIINNKIEYLKFDGCYNNVDAVLMI